MDKFPPKRVTVFPKTSEEDGVVISISQDMNMSQLQKHLEDRFDKKCKITALYNTLGARICDVNAIRDDEVLYTQKLPVPSTSAESPPPGSIPLTGTSATVPQGRPRPVSRIMRSRSGEWLTLNVGGKYFMTTRSTLVEKLPNSMLARMFSRTEENPWPNKVDETGAFLIDRSPKYFEPVLNFLRHGQLVLDKGLSAQGVLEEAKFFGIDPLIGQLEALVREEQVPVDLMPISRRELVFKLMGTESNQELRCQGVNFTNSNLSKLDLRHVNFKYAVLHGADLSSANLSYCNFERADLTQAKLDNANLLGVKMVCVSLEGASMRKANFEDPAGVRANMEGANMKSVNLEGSHMSAVNLRVANLKNANLQNCDLRGAVLAGADLENCNLSGCDLQEANLRGANLEGAAFELMLNPLHMAQTVR